MNPNSNEPREVLTPGVRENSTAVAPKKVPHPTDSAQQGALFPAGKNTPVVRPIPLTTRGRVEFTAKCPCGNWHRHITLGVVHGPCGTAYRLQPRRGRAA